MELVVLMEESLTSDDIRIYGVIEYRILSECIELIKKSIEADSRFKVKSVHYEELTNLISFSIIENNIREFKWNIRTERKILNKL